MADPVVIVEKIIDIAINIKDAMETVRENKEECRGIEKLVRRVSDLLSLLKDSEMMRHKVIGGALEDLGDAIRRAHDVVTACQAKNIFCLFCKAGKLAKKLSQVKIDISHGMMLAIFASHTFATVFVATKGQQSAVTVNVFPVRNLRTHQPPPLSEHLPSRPTVFVDGDVLIQPSLPTHEEAPHSPDAVPGNDIPPRRPAQETPYAHVSAGVSDLEPHSRTSPPRTNVVAPPLSKYLPRRQPKQPTPAPPPPAPTPAPPPPPPPPPPPRMTRYKPPPPPAPTPTPPPPPPPLPLSRMTRYKPPPPPAPTPAPPLPPPPPPPPRMTQYKTPPPAPTPPSPPPSLPLPTYVTSPIPKHQPHHSPIPSPPRHPPIANMAPPLSKHQPPSPPTQSSPPLPSRPPTTNPITSIGLTKPAHLPCPSSHVPHSTSQNTADTSAPISGPVSFTPSEDVCGISDERKNKPAESEAPPLPGLTKFSLAELKNATRNFSETNKIGSNDFGTVYKGILRDRVLVAIKKFRDPPPFLVARLSNELHLASKLQTKDVEALRNNKYIIRYLGYGHEFLWENKCLETHIFLVEELLPNGNMGNSIYGEYRLNWSSLFRIIQGLAQGLNCLHEQNIVHRNVKPAIVLLDSDMNPKITDFGIARILEKSTIHDNNIAGTVGYMPPEYILEGILSTKYDVYSFGVTLLETISGMCRSEPARHHASVPWAWNVRENEQMSELFDPTLFEKSQITEIKNCLEIGLLCTQSEWAERPTMAEVLDMLSGKIGLRTPKQPEYTKKGDMTSKGASHKVRGGR